MAETENDEVLQTEEGDAEVTQEAVPEKKPLNLQVTVKNPSACQRHVTVVIPREDIDRYTEAEYDEFVPQASVPGFRAGHAPRKLVVSRFKEQLVQQVKGKLLMDSMTQVTTSQDFSPISEPDLDIEVVEIPDEGPMTFEFTVEVRPEFDVPEWRGLLLEKPVTQITEEKVDRQLDKLLQRHGRMVERQGGAEPGDSLTVNVEFVLDGKTLSRVAGVRIPLKPKLSLRDALIENFGTLLAGATAGETRETELILSETLDDQELRGRRAIARFEVVSIERVELPKLTAAFLETIGGFSDEQDLRQGVREELERQRRYHEQQRMRQQISGQLTAGATWELPPTLLRRQSQRELRRAVLELQSAGFNNDQIQAYSNTLQRNIQGYTAAALKEHFILERIAEEEKIDAEERDFDREIELIAEQNGIPARRVRARLEKRGEIDSLRNQIVERKVLEKITAHATVRETPVEEPVDDTAALDHSVCAGAGAEIPEAKHGEEAKSFAK